MYFAEYGELNWLEPSDYYFGPWSYECYARNEDGEYYDLVRNDEDMEMRYTNV